MDMSVSAILTLSGWNYFCWQKNVIFWGNTIIPLGNVGVVNHIDVLQRMPEILPYSVVRQ